MTLIVENADSKVLAVIESLKAFNPKLHIQKEQEECPICKAHDYTPNKKTIKAIKECEKMAKKPSKRLLKALKESKQMDKNPHLYPSFDTIAELKEALEK